MRNGRPTKFSDAKEQKAIELADQGFTDQMIADVLGITRRTFDNWKKKHEHFFLSLKEAKYKHDLDVENTLLGKAKGFTKLIQKTARTKDGIDVVDIEEYYPPDVTAQIFWLKNRMPDRWRENSNIGPSDIQINLAYKSDDDSNEEEEQGTQAS